MLNEFADLRANNIKAITSISINTEDFSKRAIHPGLGVVTLSELISTCVTHNLGHKAQISIVIAKQYMDDIGPWKEYIPIVNR